MPTIRKFALTGASGTVGAHVLKYADNFGIRCVVSSRNKPKELPKLATWQAWDLRNWLDVDALDALFGDVDALLHVGAITPRKNVEISDRDFFDANVRSCLCLGSWALRKNIPVIYLSSSTVYADCEAPRIHEDAMLAYHSINYGGFYGLTKLLGEEVFYRLATEGLRLCILRPSAIYGTGMPDDQMISQFMTRALKGENLMIHPPAGSRVNLIHAADVTAAMFAALNRGVVGIYNIAAPETPTILHIAQTALRVSDKGGGVVELNQSIDNPFIRFDLNCSAAEKAFGFETRISLEKGIRCMMNKTTCTWDKE